MPAGLVGVGEQLVRKLPLVGVKAQDLLFDGVSSDQTIHCNRQKLADTVGSVGGLILYGRVPPRVEMDHIVGCGQVQTEATRL